MAFKETYTRRVSEARAKHQAPTWSVSFGYDPTLRDECVREAMHRQLISQEHGQQLLSYRAPEATSQKQLTHNPVYAECPPEVKEKLKKLGVQV